MTNHELKEEKYETKVKNNVDCKSHDKKSENDKQKEKYEKDKTDEKEETKKKLNENIQTKIEKCLMKLLCKSFKRETQDLGTDMGKPEVTTPIMDSRPNETNKRKLQIEEQMTNKKGKMALEETITKEEITKNDAENKNERENIPIQECIKYQKEMTTEKQPDKECNENEVPEKEKEMTIKKTEEIKTKENSKEKSNKNKDSTESIEAVSVTITNSKTIEEKKNVEKLKEGNTLVSIKTSMNENCKMKENGKNEEQEKYQKSLIYNNIDHNYTRSHFVSFSNKYKDGSIRLSDDQLTCYGDKGWASVFLNCGADDGKWYFEITVESSIMDLNFLGYTEKKLKINSCLRVGYACRYMRYDHPIGTNKYSYCVNSKDGKMLNSSISYDCMKAFSKGDVIGCYMNLKKKTDYKFDPRLDKKLYEYIQNGILSDPQNPPELKKSKGSLIFFALNGEIKENAFVDIYDGFYHPSVSLYMGASARINLGPNFKYTHLKDYVPCMYMHQPIVS